MNVGESGIVGATDGLLIRLNLKKAEAKGTIKAGNFTIPYEIKPLPEGAKRERPKRNASANADSEAAQD